MTVAFVWAVPAGNPHAGVLVQCPVVVRAALGMPHGVAGLKGDGLLQPEDFALVCVPRTRRTMT